MTKNLMPKAGWRVSLSDRDLTEILRPRLISLTLTEKRGEEADQLDIVIDDKDGAIELPPEGAVLSVSLGWNQGLNLPVGLIDKGTFKVDEVSASGPPDIVTLRARAADFTDALRKRRERSFVGQTVKTILEAIASDNSLKAVIEAALGAKVIPALGAGPMSDAALLRALGRRFDAIATIISGTLIFGPIGKGQTPSGKALPVETVARTQGVTHSYKRISRENFRGVEAVWHNKATGQRETVSVGESGSSKAQRLRKVYPTAVDAQAAAQAEYDRKARAKAKCDLLLALGRPDIFPDRPITLTGFKSEINAQAWIVAECSHKMDGTGGLMTDLKLEVTGT